MALELTTLAPPVIGGATPIRPTTTWLPNPQLDPAPCVPEEGAGAYALLDRYGVSPLRQERIPRAYFKLPAAERDERIWALKRQLGERLVILGHHYQRDEVVQFADFRGDSYKLSQQAAGRGAAKFILFCGVHFMAESADILSAPGQQVILPNLEAGCSMADMAKADDVQAAWQALADLGLEGVVPITYMNSAAALKAFCGRHGGIVCTSSNAGRDFDWAFARGETVFFFPDQHLGRNTGVKQGIPLDRMVVWDPFQPLGGNTPKQLRQATVILWKGFCSVHARFSVEQIAQARAKDPAVNVVVHPECRLEVVQVADGDGSTEFIIDTVRLAPAGTSWAVGTEINLVKRLDAGLPESTSSASTWSSAPARRCTASTPPMSSGRWSTWPPAGSSTGSPSTRRPPARPWSPLTGCWRCRSDAPLPPSTGRLRRQRSERRRWRRSGKRGTGLGAMSP